MLIFIVALAVAAFAGYRLYSIMMEYKAGVDEYSQIADTVVKERDADKEKIKKLKDALVCQDVYSKFDYCCVGCHCCIGWRRGADKYD